MSTTLHTFHTTPHTIRDQSLVVLSATSFGVDGEVRGLQRPHVPNYALRRLIVGAAFVVVCMFTMLAAVGVLAGFGGTPASASGVQPVRHEATMSIHVAEPGDTLWSIADTHRGDVDHARYIDVLIRLNGGTGVQAGQAVWLP